RHTRFSRDWSSDVCSSDLSFVIALTLVVFLHVVYGEMVPKNLALAAPDRAALILGPFMLAVIAILKPLVVALNAIANGAVRSVRSEERRVGTGGGAAVATG